MTNTLPLMTALTVWQLLFDRPGVPHGTSSNAGSRCQRRSLRDLCPPSPDAVPFKARSVSLHWEMVFTRTREDARRVNNERR